MTDKDFKKYAGCKTFGKTYNCNFEGGVVVGYNFKENSISLLVKVEGGNSGGTIDAIKFATSKDEEDFKSGKYTYLWCSEDYVIFPEKSTTICEPLDLTEILEGCEGVTLWSDLFGECNLYQINLSNDYPIVLSCIGRYESRVNESLSKNGIYNTAYSNSKCILWPSETNRDWSTFKKPITVKDDDWVACCDGTDGFFITKYGKLNTGWKYIIPFEKFRLNLTENELRRLSIL